MKIRKIKPATSKSLKEETLTELRYPGFGISIKHFPEAKKWEIKGKYRIVLDVDMVGLHIEKEAKKKESGRASFDITGIGILPRTTSKKEKVQRYS